MPQKYEEPKLLSLRIPSALVKEIDEQAKKETRSRNQMIEILIKKGLMVK